MDSNPRSPQQSLGDGGSSQQGAGEGVSEGSSSDAKLRTPQQREECGEVSPGSNSQSYGPAALQRPSGGGHTSDQSRVSVQGPGSAAYRFSTPATEECDEVSPGSNPQSYGPAALQRPLGGGHTSDQSRVSVQGPGSAAYRFSTPAAEECDEVSSGSNPQSYGPVVFQTPSEECGEVSPGSNPQSYGPAASQRPSGGGHSSDQSRVSVQGPGSAAYRFSTPATGKRGEATFPSVSQSAGSTRTQMEERMHLGLLASSWGKRSPDGMLLMTSSNDNVMRVFNLPGSVVDKTWDVSTELTSSRKIPESDLVYDYAWHPGMTIQDPNSCLFATTVREIPIHMFNAVTGKLVCSFRAYSAVDEIVAAHSVGFTSDGRHLVAGFNRKLRCFDVERPGRQCVCVSTVSKSKDPFTNSIKGQRGILSCFAAHPSSPKVVAAGAFNGDVAIYDLPSGAMTLAFEGQVGGITHVSFSPDGNYLFAGGRKDPEIHVFDMRNPERILYVLYRHVATNQRIYFDIDKSSRYLLSGHHNGHVTVWDLQGSTQDNPLMPWPRLDPVSYFTAHRDTANGLHINPQYPVLATCSGQRHFPESIFMEEGDSPLPEPDIEENSLKLWNLRLP
ncbi:hypothetical protein ACOMHN_011953 [Nucella lapillus]